MSELGELYQAVILDHNKNPRNFGVLQDATRHAKGHNPLCGDSFTLYVKVTNNAAGEEVIADVRFSGSGCAISKASASLMTTILKGKTRKEADAIFEKFHSVVTGQSQSGGDLGKLEVFAGVAEFPMRVKCATLAWHTLRGAIEGGDESALVTTE